MAGQMPGLGRQKGCRFQAAQSNQGYQGQSPSPCPSQHWKGKGVGHTWRFLGRVRDLATPAEGERHFFAAGDRSGDHERVLPVGYLLQGWRKGERQRRGDCARGFAARDVGGGAAGSAGFV